MSADSNTTYDLNLNTDEILPKFQTAAKDSIFKTETKNSNAIITHIKELYLNMSINLGKNWHPYVNGRYMIFMNHGPWTNDITSLSSNNYTISPSTIEFIKSVNNKMSFNFLLPKIATDIDLPQMNNEFMSVSTRNQSITYFTRQTLMPDFSISYIEDQQSLSIIQYHDAWFKALELYRRGVLASNNSINKSTSSSTTRKNPYFYDVPYLNSIWVLIFDIAFNIRGLIYLIGVKPVNHPLKEFLGNRSSSKMTVYNIQYKTTNMYYEFFNNTEDFISKLDSKSSTNNSILIQQFKTDMLKLFTTNTNTSNIGKNIDLSNTKTTYNNTQSKINNITNSNSYA